MNVIEALVLGVVQGVTEFLPISSSGHLILLEQWLGVDANSMTFDVAVHMATLLAIVWVMRKDIVEVLAQLERNTPWHRTLAFKLLVATVPVGIVGILLSGDGIVALRTSWVVAISLIVWGVVLWFMDAYVSKTPKLQNSITSSWRQSIIIGLAQAIALIPGTSRSGITMIAGLGTKMSRVQAARFSFLLSIPALAGAGLITFFDVQKTGLDIAWAPLVAGFAAAFIAGLISAQFLLNFLTSKGFKPFAVYRIVLGVIVLFSFLV